MANRKWYYFLAPDWTVSSLRGWSLAEARRGVPMEKHLRARQFPGSAAARLRSDRTFRNKRSCRLCSEWERSLNVPSSAAQAWLTVFGSLPPQFTLNRHQRLRLPPSSALRVCVSVPAVNCPSADQRVRRGGKLRSATLTRVFQSAL